MNAQTWKTWSFDKSRTFDGYVFATPTERCRYVGMSRWDRSQWLKKNEGRWRRIEDVQQEAAPPAPPVESEIDLGAEPAGPNGQPSSRRARDNGGDEDGVAVADTLTARYSLRDLRAMAEGLPVKLKPGDAGLDVWLAKLAPEKRELFIDVVRNAMRAEHQRPGEWQKFLAEIRQATVDAAQWAAFCERRRRRERLRRF
jgi:hypothetical protein